MLILIYLFDGVTALDAVGPYESLSRLPEVEIRFVPEGDARTRVELEHRGLDAYGEHAPAMRETFESAQGWGGLLQGYAGGLAG